MNVALIASWLNQYGGAERVLETVHALYPAAPVFTSTYWREIMPESYRSWDIRSTWLDRIPISNQRLLLPLYPAAFESLDVRGYDTFISITSAFAHGVRVQTGARHFCYCLTPARFLWNYQDYVSRERIGRLPRLVLPLVISRLREWDRQAASRVTQFVAISRVVCERIERHYGRQSIIINPPVDVERFAVSKSGGGYLLILSRLVPYKRIDLAIQACKRLELPLVIAGDGRDKARLEALAGPTIKFVGRPTDDAARELLAECRAFIFPGEEDFGITPLEANACGKPVIAYAGGGALDYVLPGITGDFFANPTVDSLADALAKFDSAKFEPMAIRRHSERYSTAVFQERIRQLVEC